MVSLMAGMDVEGGPERIAKAHKELEEAKEKLFRELMLLINNCSALDVLEEHFKKEENEFALGLIEDAQVAYEEHQKMCDEFLGAVSGHQKKEQFTEPVGEIEA